MAVIDRHLGNKKISLHKSLNRIAQTFIATVLLVSPVRLNAQEVHPSVVLREVYKGIASFHRSQAVPRVIVVDRPVLSYCGVVDSSGYCPPNHAIFITTNDIQMAYQQGDAALAYILLHEYAHAMQIAFGFKPSITPISELQADCLAGVYLGVIKNVYFDATDIEEIQSFAYSIGDDNTWAEDHHGTPEQRVMAVSIGMRASLAGGKGIRQCMKLSDY